MTSNHFSHFNFSVFRNCLTTLNFFEHNNTIKYCRLVLHSQLTKLLAVFKIVLIPTLPLSTMMVRTLLLVFIWIRMTVPQGPHALLSSNI